MGWDPANYEGQDRLSHIEKYMGQVLTVVPINPVGNRIYFLGDSLTADGASGAGLLRNNPGCYCSWVGPLSNERLRYAGRYGVSGNTTTQIKANVPNVLAAFPSMCLVQGGGNDIGNSVPNATIIANLKSIYNTLMQNGIMPIATTMTPRSSAPSAQKTALWQMNQWVSHYAESIGIPCVDWFSALAATNSGTDWAAGISSDAAHPNSAGAQIMGQAVCDTLAGTSYLSPNTGTTGQVPRPYRVPLVASNVDTACAINNQLFLTDTNADGIPDNWTAAGAGGTYVASVSDSSVIGNFWSATRGANDLFLSCNSVNVTAGDRMMFACRAQTSIANSGVVTIRVTDSPAAALDLAVPMYQWDTTMATTVTLYSEFTIPTGTTAIFVRPEVRTGNGTVLKLAQPTLLNLTSNGLI